MCSSYSVLTAWRKLVTLFCVDCQKKVSNEGVRSLGGKFASFSSLVYFPTAFIYNSLTLGCRHTEEKRATSDAERTGEWYRLSPSSPSNLMLKFRCQSKVLGEGLWEDVDHKASTFVDAVGSYFKKSCRRASLTYLSPLIIGRQSVAAPWRTTHLGYHLESWE